MSRWGWGMSGHTAPSPGAPPVSPLGDWHGFGGDLCGAGEGSGDVCCFQRKWGMEEARRDPDRGTVPEQEPRRGPISLLWVRLCILSQGIRACYSLPTPLPLLWALMGVSQVPHYRVGRKSLGWPRAPEIPSLSASGCSTRWLLPSVSAAGCVSILNCTACL